MQISTIRMLFDFHWGLDICFRSILKYRVSQKKGYPLKSSASAACSNLNALSPQWAQECVN